MRYDVLQRARVCAESGGHPSESQPHAVHLEHGYVKVVPRCERLSVLSAEYGHKRHDEVCRGTWVVVVEVQGVPHGGHAWGGCGDRMHVVPRWSRVVEMQTTLEGVLRGPRPVRYHRVVPDVGHDATGLATSHGFPHSVTINCEVALEQHVREWNEQQFV